MHYLNVPKLVRAFMVLSITTIAFLLIKYTFIYVYPFVIIIILTLILHPIVTTLGKRLKVSRGMITTFLLGTILGLFILITYYVIQKIAGDFDSFLNGVPEKIDYIQQFTLSVGQTVYGKVVDTFPFLKDWQLYAELDHIINNASSYLMNVLSNIVVASSHTISSFSYIVVVSIFILLSVYMLTKDFILFKYYTLKVIPDTFILHMEPILKHAKLSLIGLIKAQLFITAMSTIIIAITLFFFQFEHILLLAVIIFIVDFIPYIGIGIIFLPWILYLFITGEYIPTIQLALLYGFIILFRQIIEPKIIATQIGIHPLIALSILFIGIQTLGILGIFMTPFILIFVSALNRAGVFHLIWNYINDA